MSIEVSHSARASASSGESEGSTKERLLDAAEQLFAERGFEGASIRAVTQAAGVSVSAANYHFGNKEALLHATLRRVIAPINRERLARLDAREREAGAGPVALEHILEAFLRPGLESRSDARDQRFRHVAACLYAEPPERVGPLKEDLFGDVRQRFVAALARSLDAQSQPDVELAFQFTVGVMVHAIGGQLEPFASPSDSSDAGLVDRMIAYTAAGLRVLCATPSQGLPR